MPKDKYPSIFSRQMEAIVFIIHQLFFALGKSHVAFKPIVRARKYLMDYNNRYFTMEVGERHAYNNIICRPGVIFLFVLAAMIML